MAEKFINSPLEKHLGDIEYQKRINDSIDAKNEEVRKHVTYMHMIESDSVNVFSPCFLSKTDPNYEHPSKEVVSAVVDLIVSRGYTKADISRELGITTERNRTLNYWITESRDTQIPYSAWIHLCLLAGLMLPTMLPVKSESSHCLPSDDD